MQASNETFAAFRKLHERFFVLPDAWDVMSAILIEHCGYPAVSTTSVGLGFALGCPGDIAISKDEMLDVVGHISSAVKVGVAVDLESGYADTPEGVERVVAEVIAAGAVGVALEDSDGIPGMALRPAEEHAGRIRAARRAADRAGVALFINGRTDPFWMNDGVSDDDKAREAIRRSQIYLEAGADGMFISGYKAIPAPIVARMVQAIKAPFSTLMSAGGPSIAEFEQLGVKRLHSGSLPTRALWGMLDRAFVAMRDQGDLSLCFQYAPTTKQINEVMRPRWQAQRKKS
jgi:2-methylisocitrate lyase-like PEP mutase family enzyme